MIDGKTRDRLEEIGRRYGLTDAQRRQSEVVLTELAGDEHAPTTVRDPEAAVYVHIADSLVALEIDAIRSVDRIADVGSGAGFPGLPLAIALPETEVRLVESQSRKCKFLRRIGAAAGVENVGVVERRTEDWSGGLGANDAVLARALAPAPVVLEYAAPLLKMGGILIDWRGKRDDQEEQSALVAARELGLERREVRGVRPFQASRDRHLHLYVKVGNTPGRYPRRAGVARKRPLGCAADRPHR